MRRRQKKRGVRRGARLRQEDPRRGRACGRLLRPGSKPVQSPSVRRRRRGEAGSAAERPDPAGRRPDRRRRGQPQLRQEMVAPRRDRFSRGQRQRKTNGETKLFGFAYGGSFGHFLHKVLDYIFQGKKDTKTVAKKVLLEQITSSPWNNMLFLFYYGYVVERRPFKEVKTRVKKQYPSVQLSAWMFWPIVGWINHQYMPLQLRVIFHSFVACCWGIFLNLRARAMSSKQS